MSLVTKIEAYLVNQYPNFIHKGEIDRKTINEWGYESETAGRTCRLLQNQGLIEKKYNEKHHVMYRATKLLLEKRSGRVAVVSSPHQSKLFELKPKKISQYD